LKLRVAQLDSDLMDVSTECGRLHEERNRLHGRRVGRAPNPLGSGQSS
jgi:hypothetical protein